MVSWVPMSSFLGGYFTSTLYLLAISLILRFVVLPLLLFGRVIA
jgi:hypothetical protein